MRDSANRRGARTCFYRLWPRSRAIRDLFGKRDRQDERHRVATHIADEIAKIVADRPATSCSPEAAGRVQASCLTPNWRVLHASLKMVDDIIQAAMEWQDCHLGKPKLTSEPCVHTPAARGRFQASPFSDPIPVRWWTHRFQARGVQWTKSETKQHRPLQSTILHRLRRCGRQRSASERRRLT